MKSVILIVNLLCLSATSSSQEVYEVLQPGLGDCYCIDTYKTDFSPGDELVRSERSFLFKKLFKNWGRWSTDDCVQCCQNNAGYNGGSAGSGDSYNNGYDQDDEGYSNGYEPSYKPPDMHSGSDGHIYLPLPHPHRIISHIHGVLNRPFRRYYGGKSGPSASYPPKEAYVEEKPVVAPAKEESVPAYEAPAAVEVENSSYNENPAYTSEEPEEKNSGYDSKSSYAEEKKEEKPVQVPVATQVIQPVVPLFAAPIYIYPAQYYSPPPPPPSSYGQSAGYQPYSPPSSPYSAPTAVPPIIPSYSPPQPSYNSLPAPPASSYEYTPPTLPQPESYPTIEPASTYPALESYGPPANPIDCGVPPNYYKRTYSTSLTYLLPPSACSSPPLYASYDHDQPMKSCPELFTSYGNGPQSSMAPYPY